MPHAIAQHEAGVEDRHLRLRARHQRAACRSSGPRPARIDSEILTFSRIHCFIWRHRRTPERSVHHDHPRHRRIDGGAACGFGSWLNPAPPAIINNMPRRAELHSPRPSLDGRDGRGRHYRRRGTVVAASPASAGTPPSGWSPCCAWCRRAGDDLPAPELGSLQASLDRRPGRALGRAREPLCARRHGTGRARGHKLAIDPALPFFVFHGLRKVAPDIAASPGWRAGHRRGCRMIKPPGRARPDEPGQGDDPGGSPARRPESC